MRDLVLEDNPILNKRGIPFDFDNPQEDPIKLTEELLDAMVKYEGMGLSACQIGVDLKVFVMRFNGDAIACFNPRINHYSEETTYMREGCLSYPGLFFPVTRAKGINATYSGKEGDEMSASFIDISAKVFQHEYDHMLGKVYLEYASAYMIRNARKKQVLWERKRKNNGGKTDKY
jgi:peptide deformylase